MNYRRKQGKKQNKTAANKQPETVLNNYDIEIFYFRPQFYPINNWDNEEFQKIKKTTETYKYKLGITSY